MALTADKANVWRARIEPLLDTQSVYKQALCNSNYEGEVGLNSTLNIVTVGDVSESEYTGAWAADAWSAAATTAVTFQVDQKRKFALKVPDTDQMDSIFTLVDEGAKRAVYAIVNQQDSYIASLYTQIAAGNGYGSTASPITVGFGAAEVKPIDALTRLMEELADAKAPMTNPRVVVPIWFSTMLRQELGSRATALGDSAIGGGATKIGQGLVGTDIAGFAQVWASANVPNTTGEKYRVIAGDPYITFASKLAKVETGRIELDFADFVKGLYIYGGKIPFTEHMALGTFNKGTYRENA